MRKLHQDDPLPCLSSGLSFGQAEFGPDFLDVFGSSCLTVGQSSFNRLANINSDFLIPCGKTVQSEKNELAYY
jgi:hypothetical protein